MDQFSAQKRATLGPVLTLQHIYIYTQYVSLSHSLQISPSLTLPIRPSLSPIYLWPNSAPKPKQINISAVGLN